MQRSHWGQLCVTEIGPGLGTRLQNVTRHTARDQVLVTKSHVV